MNKQRDGSKRGIEWTDYTWNPVGGCHHACRWTMPDGTTAICYAEAVAEKLRSSTFYPDGFQAHYWHADRLEEPLSLRRPARIFLDSMSDLMGHWVPDEQIRAVLDVCRRAEWHTFQLLTKNAPRLTRFDFPANVWVGVSMLPSTMLGRDLSREQQSRYIAKALTALRNVSVPVRWMSFEPLSFHIAPQLFEHFTRTGKLVEWAVIGAATNGAQTYQPDRYWVSSLLETLDRAKVPVFFKGNLDWTPWREEFPKTKLPAPPDAPVQPSLF